MALFNLALCQYESGAITDALRTVRTLVNDSDRFSVGASVAGPGPMRTQALSMGNVPSSNVDVRFRCLLLQCCCYQSIGDVSKAHSYYASASTLARQCVDGNVADEYYSVLDPSSGLPSMRAFLHR